MKKRFVRKLAVSILLSMSFIIVLLQTHSPSNQTDVIYFLLIDRFADGDSTNNSGNNPDGYVQFTGENFGALKTYQGGDLRGIIQKLYYLKELGITVIWLSPFLDNSDTDYVGWWAYHGYHPIDFYSIDEHFGTLNDLKELVNKAHSLDMKVIFDMPFNQTAQDHPWLDDGDKKQWYHYGPDGKPFDITDWFDQEQIERGELHGLPDLAQENDEVYAYLLDVSKYWITETGCDGFRLDAVKHIPLSFWTQYNEEIRRFAGDEFILLGEVFWGEPARIVPYSDAGFTHLFDIPGYYLVRNIFASGASIKYLSEGLQNSEKLWERTAPVTLIDNHDVARFPAGIDEFSWEKEKLALSYLFTMPGIPMLYYGTEIGMEGAPVVNPETGEPQDYLNRLPFPAEFDSAMSAYFNDIQELIKLRKQYPVFASGDFYEVYKDWGIYGYIRVIDKEGVLVSLNTSLTDEVIITDLNGWQLKIDPAPIFGNGIVNTIGDKYQLSLPALEPVLWRFELDSCVEMYKWTEFTNRLTGDYHLMKFEYFDSTGNVEKFQIAGDFNNWQPEEYPTVRKEKTISSEIPLRKGEYRYKFVLNGSEWTADPKAAKFELDPWGGKNSIIEVKGD